MFINTRIVRTAESQALRVLHRSNAWVVRGLSTHQLARIWPAQQSWNSGPISQGDWDAKSACEEDGVPCLRKPTALADVDWFNREIWAVGVWPITASRAVTLLKQSPVLKKGSGMGARAGLLQLRQFQQHDFGLCYQAVCFDALLN